MQKYWTDSKLVSYVQFMEVVNRQWKKKKKITWLFLLLVFLCFYWQRKNLKIRALKNSVALLSTICFNIRTIEWKNCIHNINKSYEIQDTHHPPEIFSIFGIHKLKIFYLFESDLHWRLFVCSGSFGILLLFKNITEEYV